MKHEGNHNVASLLLLVGGHLAINELLQHQAKMAVYNSFGVAICILIFIGMQVLISRVGRGD